jgi:hypothetical protein
MYTPQKSAWDGSKTRLAQTCAGEITAVERRRLSKKKKDFL